MNHQTIRKRTEPAFIEPMQCKPVTALPAGEKWTFEIKFDGYRCTVVKRGREVTLFSRNQKALNKRFPKVVEALDFLGGESVLDGELVDFDSQGRPSLQLLQSNLSRTLPVYFYPFDLLNRDGELLVNLPIERRRELLGSMSAAPEDPCPLSPLLRAPSGQILEAVRKPGLEGVVGKRIDSIYEPGERPCAWIKHRTNMEQEFVIGGYIPGAHGFDALLVGVYENNELVFVAKVKDGFVPRIRDEILPALKKLSVVHCPFKNLPEKRDGFASGPVTIEDGSRAGPVCRSPLSGPQGISSNQSRRQREVISLRSGKDILFKYRCSSWTNAPSRLRNSFAICRCCAATSVCSRGSVFRSYSRSYPPSISTMYLKRPSVTPIW
jgi:ATP-dependent DNA ligase